jgi:hypothetical protein
MLEFKKRILMKVSFDLMLFEKELRKAIKWLQKEESIELRNWCYQQFSKTYWPIVDRCYTRQVA